MTEGRRKLKTYRYIIDGANDIKLLILKRALEQVPDIATIGFQSSVLTLECASNPERSMKLAIAVAGVQLRSKIR